MPYRDPATAFKRCNKCGQVLSLDNFYNSPQRVSTYCKECSRAYAREHKYYQKYRDTHREEINARSRERNKTTERREYKRRYDQKRKFPYHIVLDDAGVERVCASCGTVNNLGVHHKDLDHNNNELSNLQWLCTSCHNKLHNEEKIPKLERDALGKFKRKEE